MPGPGGGAHGGGGGHHSSFRGGMYGSGPKHIHRGGLFFGPRYYGGRGCLSSLFSMMVFPIIFVLLLFYILFSSVSSSVSDLARGGNVKYDENKFQDYADTKYAAEFDKSIAYEDNIMLVFLVDDEEYYDYYYIAWAGDHITTSINYMFGNENTEFGRVISTSINTNSYKYLFDSNLSQIIETMKTQIDSLELNSSFTCEEDHIQVESHLVNETSLDLTEETVNSALVSFTEQTGIPIVVVVEDIEDVFSKEMASQSIITIVILIILIAFVVYLIVRNICNNNKNKNYDYKDCYWEEKKE